MPDTLEPYVPMPVSAASLGYGKTHSSSHHPWPCPGSWSTKMSRAARPGLQMSCPWCTVQGAADPTMPPTTTLNPTNIHAAREEEGGPRLTLPLTCPYLPGTFWSTCLSPWHQPCSPRLPSHLSRNLAALDPSPSHILARKKPPWPASSPTPRRVPAGNLSLPLFLVNLACKPHGQNGAR